MENESSTPAQKHRTWPSSVHTCFGRVTIYASSYYQGAGFRTMTTMYDVNKFFGGVIVHKLEELILFSTILSALAPTVYILPAQRGKQQYPSINYVQSI